MPLIECHKIAIEALIEAYDPALTEYNQSEAAANDRYLLTSMLEVDSLNFRAFMTRGSIVATRLFWQPLWTRMIERLIGLTEQINEIHAVWSKSYGTDNAFDTLKLYVKKQHLAMHCPDYREITADPNIRDISADMDPSFFRAGR